MSPRHEDAVPYLSHDVCAQLVARVTAFARGGGRTHVEITSWWNGELRWARNRVHLASDRCDQSVSVMRGINYGQGASITNQLDDASLEAVVRIAERRSKELEQRHVFSFNSLPEPDLPTPAPIVWSDTTSKVTAQTRGAVARTLSESAESANMLSAGYLEMRAASRASTVWETSQPLRADEPGSPRIQFDQWTQAQCSATVRHPKGIASGWAGGSSFDWASLDGASFAQRALEKCLASVDPVRIEPGRYTTILEPQAVCQLMEPMMEWDTLQRESAERQGPNYHTFYLSDDEALGIGRSKIGLRIIDERITISHDPLDPLLGVLPAPGMGRFTFIENGVLKALCQEHKNARWKLRDLTGDLYRPSFRMSGGETSIQHMIETTKRGLLVTRFSHVEQLSPNSLLCTGLTRDGIWLVEDGKVTKAVKNFRFTESPLFVLNQVEQLGPPVPVFRPVVNPAYTSITPAVIPPLKVRDFSFTSLIDAI